MVYFMDTVLSLLLMAIVILGSSKMAYIMGKERLIIFMVFMLAITMSVIGTQVLSMVGAYSLPTASYKCLVISSELICNLTKASGIWEKK